MGTSITFGEYDGMYKRIINEIELEIPITFDSSTYYENGTSLEDPLAYDDLSFFGRNGLFINDSYFEQHKQEVFDLIIDTIYCSRKEEFTLTGDEIITKDVIKAICDNNYIKTVYLNAYKGLSKEELEILLDSGLESINCTINYDDNPEMLYEYFPKVTFANYPSVCSNTVSNFAEHQVELIIDDELDEEELEQLKRLFEKYPQESIYIDFKYKDQMKEILSAVKSDEILIRDQHFFKKEDYEFFAENYDNAIIVFEEEFGEPAYTSPKHIVEKDNILNMIISEVKELNLSTLEQYMYLYNITKMMKEYKEVTAPDDNDLLSRETVFALFNDYMVCVGYTSLLEELVEKLDNPDLIVVPYSCVIEDNAEIIGHRRCLVKIKDEKYGVDGVYISDPTWDCVDYYETSLNENEELVQDLNSPTAHFDFYNHFLMTREEMLDEDIEYASGDVTDIIFGVNLPNEERTIKSYVYQEADEVIKTLSSNKAMTREMIDSEIEKIKQPIISGNTIVSAISSLYSKIYSGTEEQIENMVESTMEINHKAQDKHFSSSKDKFNYSKIRQ